MDIISNIKRYITEKNDFGAYQDLLLLCQDDLTLKENRDNVVWLSDQCEKGILRSSGDMVGKLYYLHESVLKTAAPFDFESYMLFTEWNRELNTQFYRPRRTQLRTAVKKMQDLEDDKLDILGISMPPGSGKALANDTPILTRKGWKNHGDLVVGDEVIGLNGEFKRVLAVHPKCMLDRLVTFSNGEQIQCHKRHEWRFYDRAKGKEHLEETQEWEKRTLETGIPNKRGHRYILQLPHHAYIQGEEKELPLDPYTLGVWLGDGVNRNPTISTPEKDLAIIDRIERSGNPVSWRTVHKTTGVHYIGFGFRKNLQTMGMCHSKAATPKHIPEMYLTASIKQRLDLLAGLLDTDGTLLGNKYQFSTTSEELKDGFIALVSTFGWRCCVNRHEPKVSSSGIIGRKPVYVIGFSPDIPIPCELPRKRNKGTKQRAISVTKIEIVEPKEGNCITVEGDGMYLAGKTMLPTHNTTLALFYLTWLAGKYPDLGNLTGSHNGDFIKGCYEECLRMTAPNSEYRWQEVFPGIDLVKADAKSQRIDFGIRSPRRETLQFTTVGSGNAGLYRAMKLLYCDDLVSGLEVALSKDALDKLWGIYTTDLKQRKLGYSDPKTGKTIPAKELHIATRWSVHDILGRLEEQYSDSDRACFLRMPVMDENGESLFDYKNAPGYPTSVIMDIKNSMDEPSFQALYMNEPIEREGLLFPTEELRYYSELPRDSKGKVKEPDSIIAICDTKDKGQDYAFEPIAYVYGQDYYIEDCICDNGLPAVVDIRLAEMLLKHNVRVARYESNNAGRRTAEKVQEYVKRKGGITHITTKDTTANKITKIIAESPWVISHCLFKTKDQYVRNSDYGRMMNFINTFTMSGKNKHDDVPDGLAQLSQYAQSFAKNYRIFKRPW